MDAGGIRVVVIRCGLDKSFAVYVRGRVLLA